MWTQVSKYVRACHICQQHNPTNQPKLPTQHQYVTATQTWTTVHIDYCDMGSRGRDGKRYLLVVVDALSRYVIAVPVKHCNSESTAMVLVNHLCLPYRIPNTIISDNGTHFTADNIKAVSTIIGTQQSFVSAYHQSANGTAERAIANIKQTIAKMLAERGSVKKDWSNLVTTAVSIINKSINATTGYTPYYLIHGTNPHTPHIDTHMDSTVAMGQHVEQMISNLAQAHRHIREQVSKTQQQTVQAYDRVKQAIAPGMRVWVKRQVRRSLEPRWVGPVTVKEVRNRGASILVQTYGMVNRAHIKPYRGVGERSIEE